MPNDPQTLIGLAVGAVIVVWLVFSVLRKLFGLALLAAIVLGAAVLWFNPGLAQLAWTNLQAFLGTR
ncbi:hypothetical protein [Devosia faecipullorum]|uniref:hypothetical protein n=1 Tax=Devosia faecipullorum TaxID=2755039 RepID=UPI00187B6DEE|nr:hypothetical protein [Devosia faecipullorum]MBE7732217.1 hypothetical protein [Devosia faecipullorum]